MDFLRIFETETNGLFAIRYDGDSVDEFSRLFDLWQDVEYLLDFFTKNRADLSGSFYGIDDIERAVLLTLDDAYKLQKDLLDIRNNENNSGNSLNFYFRPLDNISYKPEDLQKSKAYGILEKSWIRLYAIKLAENFYVITGGAIKLTHRMSERAHTQKELQKLDKCRDYLRAAGIFDEDGVKDILK